MDPWNITSLPPPPPTTSTTHHPPRRAGFRGARTGFLLAGSVGKYCPSYAPSSIPSASAAITAIVPSVHDPDGSNCAISGCVTQAMKVRAVCAVARPLDCQ